jgi:SAM-dependent methyltransferase
MKYEILKYKNTPSIYKEHIEKFRGGEIVDEEIYGFLNNDLIKQDLTGKNILDLGCSDGERLLSQLAGREAKNIFGIDNQDAAVKDALKMKERKKSEGIDVSNLSIIKCDYAKERMPFEDKSIDVVVCAFSFDADGLNEIKRVLKDDGVLIIGCTITEITNQDFIDEKINEAKQHGEEFKFPITINRGDNMPEKKSKSYLSLLDEKVSIFEKGGWEIATQEVFTPKNIRINIHEGDIDFSKYINYKQGYFRLLKKKGE